jgi:CRP/FNR family transcriptional regulator, anaerobic regulatory protein
MVTMGTATLREQFLAIFGSLFPKEEWPPIKIEPIFASLQYRDLDAGTTILREGQTCASVPFVLDGVIRVFKTAESGREISLYRIETGQICILSSGCGTGLASFPASVVAENRTSAAFLKRELFQILLNEGPTFRSFVFDQYSRRLAEIFELVEEIAFRKVDERLSQWFTEMDSEAPGKPISATHQILADHVGTSREVVSRILKDWEQRGFIEISRGSLKILPGFRTILAPK